MLLSRVAETGYWIARYIERAEDTARIIMFNTNLLLDLPKTIRPGWEPLLAITGSMEDFLERHEHASERAIVKFLIGDCENPGSILSSLSRARENMRITRAIVPREAWETLNKLHLFAKENVATGMSRRGQYEYLRQIIGSCQQVTGILAGTMSHDPTYWFLRIGRNLERADMTARVLDVRSANLLPKDVEELRSFDDIQWVNVLKSLTAYQMYRRHVHVRVRGAAVLGYLLQDRAFPRAVNHCLGEVERSLRELPRNDSVLRRLGRAQRMLQTVEVHTLNDGGLHEFIDRLELVLNDVHAQLESTYFRVEEAVEDIPVLRAAGATA